MNTEITDLALLFTSAFVGATIAFLAALITFTFHHEIREHLVLRGLIVPPNEPRPENHERLVRALPIAQLPPQNEPAQHLQVENFPITFAAWGNRIHDPWAEPPNHRPHRLPNEGNIWDPHP